MSKRGLPLVWASGPPRVKFWSRFSWSQLRLVSSSSSVPPVRSTLVASGLDAHSASGSVPTPQTPLSPVRSSCIPGISVFLSGDIPIIGPIKSKRSREREKKKLLILNKLGIRKQQFCWCCEITGCNILEWCALPSVDLVFLSFPWGHTPCSCACLPFSHFLALSLSLSSTPGEDREALSFPPLFTPSKDLWGGPLKQLNRLKAPLLDAHLVSDKTQLLVMCKWAWNHPVTARMSGSPPSYRVDGSYRLIYIQPESSLNLSQARLSSVKWL